MKRVFTVGVYDLFHVGHLRLLEKASKLGDELIVGVVSDKAVREEKGDGRPIIRQEQRMEIISKLCFVTTVIPVETFNPFNEYEYTRRKIQELDSKKVLLKHCSDDDVYIVVKGEDQHHLDYSQVEKKYNPIIVTLQRTKDISTSEIVSKVG